MVSLADLTSSESVVLTLVSDMLVNELLLFTAKNGVRLDFFLELLLFRFEKTGTAFSNSVIVSIAKISNLRCTNYYKNNFEEREK